MTAISCFMPTTDERWWCRHLAIKEWSRQRGPDDELVIAIEDDSSWGICGENVRVVRVPRGIPFTTKRNLGIEACRNPWVLFWDDDDWHGSGRIAATRAATTRISSLSKQRGAHDRPPQIVGQTEMLYHELIGEERTFRYSYPIEKMIETPYVIGGTMAFEKKLWEKDPLSISGRGGDEGWWTLSRLRDDDVPYVLLPNRVASLTYVAMIHEKNVSGVKPRVSASGRVLSDSYTTLLGGAEALDGIIPEELLAQYHAAFYAQSGEQE